MTYVIAEPCVGVKDMACVDVCPVDCIYEVPAEQVGEGAGQYPDMLVIHPGECIDCGACMPVCPVEAIFPEAEVPADWEKYTKINADFFE